jgi:hypothetical protein
MEYSRAGNMDLCFTGLEVSGIHFICPLFCVGLENGRFEAMLPI